MRQAQILNFTLTVVAALSLAACAHTALRTASDAGPGDRAKGPAPAPAQVVSTDGALRKAGESQAVIAGGFLFASAQLPRAPKTGEVAGGTTAATERVIDNLEAVLRAAGLTLADVVKTTVFLTSSQEFDDMNAVYRRRFGAGLPARTTLVVDSVLCDCLLEIDAIAKTRDAKGSPATNP